MQTPNSQLLTINFSDSLRAISTPVVSLSNYYRISAEQLQIFNLLTCSSVLEKSQKSKFFIFRDTLAIFIFKSSNQLIFKFSNHLNVLCG